MAKPRSRDKFHVGQVVALVLDQKTGHEQYNNRITTVIAARVWGAWKCSDPLRKERGAEVCEDWRYAVRHPGDGSKWYVTEEMLRPIYEGEALSTWAKFAKATGFRPNAEAVVIETPKKPRRGARS